MVKQVSCREAGLDCDFLIRDEDENELIEFVRQHASDTHDMEMSPDEVREHITDAAS